MDTCMSSDHGKMLNIYYRMRFARFKRLIGKVLFTAETFHAHIWGNILGFWQNLFVSKFGAINAWAITLSARASWCLTALTLLWLLLLVHYGFFISFYRFFISSMNRGVGGAVIEQTAFFSNNPPTMTYLHPPFQNIQYLYHSYRKCLLRKN